MLSRIKAKFKELEAKGKKAFIPFLMSGDPSLELSKELVLAAEEKGADIIELGIPYSNALADGPTIQSAAQRALTNNINLSDIFQLVKEIRAESEIPIILMGYYNSLFNYGLENFIKDCEESGVDGAIIPDLPPEENKELRDLSNQVDLILLLSTTSNDSRIEKVTNLSTGFIYAVSTPGTTGTRKELSLEIKDTIEKIKGKTDLPVAVGFGISNPEHVKQVADFADGVIVGSAIIEQIENNLESEQKELIKEVGGFIAELTAPLK